MNNLVITPVNTEARNNIERYESSVIKIEQRGVYLGRILFYGNSYFGLWDRESMEKMFSGIPGEKPVTLNHGFGGATSAELWHYYHRLVKPYSPRVLVWTEGANDFYEGYSVSEAIASAYQVFIQAERDFPGIKIILLSPIDVPKDVNTFYMELNASVYDLQKKYNEMLEAYAYEHRNCTYIDIGPFFHKSGNIENRDDFVEYFREDKVHLTDEGYIQFSSYLSGILSKII